MVGTVGAGGGAVVAVDPPVPPPEEASANVTGMNRSSERSEERVWSARDTTAQRTWRQSMPSASSGVSVIVPLKVPPCPYGVGTPIAYTGGFEETHSDESLSAPWSPRPPPHGEGGRFVGGITQKAT